jgi:hypothetical protein
MKQSSVFVVIMAVVILMAALSGCLNSSSPPVVQVATTPLVTYTAAPIPTVTLLPTAAPVPEPDSGAIADTAFAGAADACIAANPVISNITTQMAFTTCLQNAPYPSGLCAVNYKYNLLKTTKDDVTSAGYSRENMRIPLVRDAYSRNLSYNTQTDTVGACNRQPPGVPI